MLNSWLLNVFLATRYFVVDIFSYLSIMINHTNIMIRTLLLLLAFVALSAQAQEGRRVGQSKVTLSARQQKKRNNYLQKHTERHVVYGKVKSSDGEVLVGTTIKPLVSKWAIVSASSSIYLSSDNKHVYLTTSSDGTFSFVTAELPVDIAFSYIGMKPEKVHVTADNCQNLQVIMENRPIVKD